MLFTHSKGKHPFVVGCDKCSYMRGRARRLNDCTRRLPAFCILWKHLRNSPMEIGLYASTRTFRRNKTIVSPATSAIIFLCAVAPELNWTAGIAGGGAAGEHPYEVCLHNFARRQFSECGAVLRFSATPALTINNALFPATSCARSQSPWLFSH